MRKIISFMHITLDGFVAGPNGELNWAKVDGEVFEHVGKRIGKTDMALKASHFLDNSKIDKISF